MKKKRKKGKKKDEKEEKDKTNERWLPLQLNTLYLNSCCLYLNYYSVLYMYIL